MRASRSGHRAMSSKDHRSGKEPECCDNVSAYCLVRFGERLIHRSLRNMKREVWGDSVDIVAGDMRQCDLPVKVDLLVSELLGSFGDNELSPECLDGAQRLLKGTV